MPRINLGSGLAYVVQERRCEQVRLAVTCAAQRAHDVKAMALIGDAHLAEKFLRARREELVGLAQLFRRNACQPGAHKLAHAVENGLYAHGDLSDLPGFENLLDLKVYSPRSIETGKPSAGPSGC